MSETKSTRKRATSRRERHRDLVEISPADIRRVDRFGSLSGVATAEGPLVDALAERYRVEPRSVQLFGVGSEEKPQPLRAVITLDDGGSCDTVLTVQLPATARAWYLERVRDRSAARPLSIDLGQCPTDTALLVRHPEGRGRVLRMDPYAYGSESPEERARAKRVRLALAAAWALRDKPAEEVHRAVVEFAGDAERQAEAGYTGDDLAVAVAEFDQLTMPYQRGWDLSRCTAEAARSGGAR